jgi:hypothetical protein
MELHIEMTGEVVERQELLNGTQSVTLEGADAGGVWALVAGLSWNVGLVDYVGEGDLALTRADGAEIFATLAHAAVVATQDSDEDADHAFRLTYEIDGGAGTFADASGAASAEGSLAGDTFSGRWSLYLDSPRAA